MITLYEMHYDDVAIAIGDNEHYFVDKNGKKVRLFQKRGDIFRYVYKSNVYGYALNEDDMKNIYLKKNRVSISERWQKSWTDILNNLIKWGLWPELQNDIKIGLSIGYETVCQLYDAYWEEPFDERFNRIKRIAGGGYEPGYDISTFVCWEMSKLPRKRKMRFHRQKNSRHITEKYLQDIERAMLKHEEYSCVGDNGYDVSFRYDGKDSAWYAEEYRDCGNGHYYLAYSPTHAFHYEDD